MFYSNVHTHSTFCDGKNTLAEMAQKALDLKMTDLGFTSHSYAPFDPGCLGVKDEVNYQKAVREVAAAFPQLNILCGLEWDYFSPPPISGYDYLIGSVHYFAPRTGVYASVDESPESFQNTLDTWFSGDFLKMAAEYYQLVVTHITENQPLIVGHFDLITKFNDALGYLNSDNQQAYEKLAREALGAICDQLPKWQGMVEVNTGGISRGWCTKPYPADFLLKDLIKRNIPLIITSDSHETKTLDFGFQQGQQQLQKLGLTASYQLKDRQFQSVTFDELKQ